MRQIDLKTLFLNFRSPADTFWYLGGAPTTNFQSYTAFESKVVDDHFGAKIRFFTKSRVLTVKWRVSTWLINEPRNVLIFGVRQWESVQKLSNLQLLFGNQNFRLLQCIFRHYFAAWKVQFGRFFKRFRTKFRKISIFWPNFQWLKMTSKCVKLT